MPREVLVQWVADESVTGQKVGSTSLRFGIDADEATKLGLCVILDEHPAPRHWLLNDRGEVEVGVMSSSQAKMSAAQRAGEQEFLKDQIRALDARHEAEQTARDAKDNLERKKKEVSRG